MKVLYEKWKEEHPGRRILLYKRSVLDAFETPEELDVFFEMLIAHEKEVKKDGTTSKH